ncbi:hypothetical protein W97_07050 [Coniosporium apollinis CBS 100218]|uniref:Prion-inhibition and propagation HeLo domain-containing protein n=1 Tax=Coniosporium apollinis (strain CBS 100218) TaxID=1168221 RepID=R7Z0Q7_CONA1|nr:uncharacterized protein W97_07050 [Coniosporium apollinis CBS 100218]EON67795.1 hypothetical protein W97_07050 [Coniosporium apollinis CBS 100218]
MEVALLTAAIVSTFAGATTLLRSWRNDRQARRQARRRPRGKQAADGASSLEVVLQDGGPRVQSEYDRDFARLGELFGRGDFSGLPDDGREPSPADLRKEMGRSQLKDHVIVLQGTIITLLQNAQDRALPAIPQLGLILGNSEASRDGAITALANQYQRMLQTKPIE